MVCLSLILLLSLLKLTQLVDLFIDKYLYWQIEISLEYVVLKS